MKYRAIVRYPAGQEPERPVQEFGSTLSQVSDWARDKVKILPRGCWVEIFEMTERLVGEVRG